MTPTRIIYFFIPAAFLFTAAIKKTPGPDQYAETITAADLRKHLTVLASDEYEGRETGQPGQKMAAEYISAFYSSIGVPAQNNGTWYQEVKLVRISGGTSEIKVHDPENAGAPISLSPGTDYYYASSTPGTEIKAADLVFAGYGIDDPNYSDYAGIDSSLFRGKVLLVLDGEPSVNGTFTITGESKPGKWTKQRRAKVEAAKNYKAKALLIIPQDFGRSKEMAQHSIEGYSLVLDEPMVTQEENIPVFHLNISAADTILAVAHETRNIRDLRNAINATGKPVSFVIAAPVSLTVTRKEEHISSENVLGYVEGSDLKDEVVVVTGHYDHLGKKDGVVFNGADDDGSGTVAVMELAEAFMKAKTEGHGPRRSMLFMTVTGEEKGLLGSAWYTRHPVYPLEKTTCNLNIDMIGRADPEHSSDSNFVYVIGSDKIDPELKKAIESANKKHCHLKLDYRYDDEKDPNMFYYRSDHYNFARNGVPVAFFFNGTHADYHKETDEVSKINFNLMEKRARLVFYTAWDIANRNKPLVHKIVKPR